MALHLHLVPDEDTADALLRAYEHVEADAKQRGDWPLALWIRRRIRLVRLQVELGRAP